MKNNQYPELENEIASAVIARQRKKSGVVPGTDIGPREEKIARKKAGQIIELLHLSVMNHKRSNDVTTQDIEALLAPHRNKTDKVDLDGLRDSLSSKATQTYVRDLYAARPDAQRPYNDISDRIKRVMTLQR